MLTATASEMRIKMRDLWSENVLYTHSFIVSSLAGLPDLEAVTLRLHKNQDDIGNAIKPYYGDEAGKKLTTMLREHSTIATEMMTATKAGKAEDVTKAQARWTTSGKSLGTFFSSANPNWVGKDLEAMLQKHMDLTTKEVNARMAKDWAGDIKATDESRAQMMLFADALATGTVKQYPDKFKDAQMDTPTPLGRDGAPSAR